jgi:peptidoglycan/xylan/chitin deacetylase (PgdA/CDA1 family)
MLISVFTSACYAILPPALIERGEEKLTFNEASEREILSFAAVILNMPPLSADFLAPKLELSADKINIKSVLQVHKRIFDNLYMNYLAAISKKNKTAAHKRFIETAKNFAVDSKRAEFYEAYFYELMRLAALFPKISSEIERLDGVEILGDEFGDREFLLTFDDGPSAKDGSTDQLIRLLNEHNQSALFFVLGENAAKRQNELQILYNNQYLASHGWQHISHAKTQNAKESILKTHELLSDLASYTKVFRPPYGQRGTELSAFLKEQNIRLVLWNIDSQDWQKNVSAKAAAERVWTLMLVWRKGVILFHDTHDKAKNALPILFERAKYSSVTFSSPREISVFFAADKNNK